METKKYFFSSIDDLKEKLMKIFAIEYGEVPSLDELIKFKSIDNLNSLSFRKRFDFLNRCNHISNNFCNKDIIDYILTLSKLYENVNIVEKHGRDVQQLLLLEIFTHIPTADYSAVIELLNDSLYMKRLEERVNDIAREQSKERKFAIIRDIASQFVSYLMQYKEENKDLSTISKEELLKTIEALNPRGSSTIVDESIIDNPIKR